MEIQLKLYHKYLVQRKAVILTSKVEEWIVIDVAEKAVKVKREVDSRISIEWLLKDELSEQYYVIEDLGDCGPQFQNLTWQGNMITNSEVQQLSTSEMNKCKCGGNCACKKSSVSS
jgi:hypothetical protein